MTSDEKIKIIEINNITKIYQLDQFGLKSFRNDILKLFKLNKQNFKKIKALDSLSFNIYKGEKIAVIGNNGSGKSTLMRILSGITKPTYGEVILRETITSALQGSFAFQNDLTARDNIYQFCALKGLNLKKTNDIFNTIVEFAECENFIETPIKRFSSGMSMKLALSIAINIPGEIMIFDEIFNYIDSKFKEKVIGFLKKDSLKEKTLILVSHDKHLVNSLCEKAILMEKGNIKLIGTLEEVFKNYQF